VDPSLSGPNRADGFRGMVEAFLEADHGLQQRPNLGFWPEGIFVFVSKDMSSPGLGTVPPLLSLRGVADRFASGSVRRLHLTRI